jgi:hypothetical protein
VTSQSWRARRVRVPSHQPPKRPCAASQAKETIDFESHVAVMSTTELAGIFATCSGDIRLWQAGDTNSVAPLLTFKKPHKTSDKYQISELCWNHDSMLYFNVISSNQSVFQFCWSFRWLNCRLTLRFGAQTNSWPAATLKAPSSSTKPMEHTCNRCKKNKDMCVHPNSFATRWRKKIHISARCAIIEMSDCL